VCVAYWPSQLDHSKGQSEQTIKAITDSDMSNRSSQNSETFNSDERHCRIQSDLRQASKPPATCSPLCSFEASHATFPEHRVFSIRVNSESLPIYP
jgi:hypothetical protein